MCCGRVIGGCENCIKRVYAPLISDLCCIEYLRKLLKIAFTGQSNHESCPIFCGRLRSHIMASSPAAGTSMPVKRGRSEEHEGEKEAEEFKAKPTSTSAETGSGSGNAFQELMQNASKQQVKKPKSESKSSQRKDIPKPLDWFEEQARRKIDILNPYFQQLQQDKGDNFVYVDKACFVIKDKYPKGTYHYLIIPRLRRDAEIDEDSASKLLTEVDTSTGHLRHDTPEIGSEFIASNGSELPLSIRSTPVAFWPVLFHMHKVAHGIVKSRHEGCEIITGSPRKSRGTEVSFMPSELFRTGFHLNPSLAPLHMHVVSQDLQCESALKYCKFSTSFFVDSMSIIRHLVTSNTPYSTISGSVADQWIKRKTPNGEMKQLESHVASRTFHKLQDLRSFNYEEYAKREFIGVFCRCRLPKQP
eukprot:gb/GECG01004374.1/.p1 GENE.gb/GECG01004374.1/~~gb/GECG01004374.1/.p1  ORF type:complete len:416 (+),score=42.35 gb/GECG01004374.1/:1-1248(+)